MAKYIDADKLCEGLKDMAKYQVPAKQNTILGVVATIRNTRAADVEEVRHGEWKHTDLANHWLGKDECSECGYHTTDRDDLAHYNYCPRCGARMDGGNKCKE